MRSTSLEIPLDLLETSRLSIDDLKKELALHLYKERKISQGKAREFAGLSLWGFRQLLATRKINVHYDVEDLTDDQTTFESIGK